MEKPSEVLQLSFSPHSTHEQAEKDSQSTQGATIALSATSDISRIDRLVRIAFFLLICSLVIPWFQVGVSGPEYWSPSHEPIKGTWVFAPAWSPFLLSSLGTKFSLHFFNLLVGLSASIALMAVARKTLGRDPKIASLLLWISTSFSGVALLFFAVFFPRVGYVGDVFWPFGSSSCMIPGCETSFTWFIMPGFFVALISLLLQLLAAGRLTRIYWRSEAGKRPKESPEIRLSVVHDVRIRWLSWNIAWIVIAAGVWVGLSYSPQVDARSLANDLADEWAFSFKSFKPGDTVTLTDQVISASLIRTSYGDYTLIVLGNRQQSTVQVFLKGDQKANYQAGSRVSIPVHFDEYYYNDIPFVWSDVAIAPFPIFLSIYSIFQAVSVVAGLNIHAAPNATSSNRFEVFGDLDLPLDKFRMTLTKASYPYISESGIMDGEWHPGMVDEMTPIHVGTSRNQTVTFVDVNSDGLLNTGDSFDLDLPPTRDRFHFDTYMMNIVGPPLGLAYIVVGSEGPLLFYLHESETSEGGIYSLDMPPDTVNGGNCSSRVIIDRILGRPESASNYELGFYSKNAGLIVRIPADTTDYVLSDGVRVEYFDQATLGILDEGDFWRFDNLTEFGYYGLELLSSDTSIMGNIQWACGLGYNKPTWPEVELSIPVRDPMDPSRFLIDVESVKWVPAGFTLDYFASLDKNGVRLLPISMNYSRLQPFDYLDQNALPQGPSLDGQGTWLSFNDANANKLLDPGDYLVVNNTASGAKYEIALYYGYVEANVATVNWTA